MLMIINAWTGLAVLVGLVWAWLALRFFMRLWVFWPVPPVGGPIPAEAPAIDVIVPARNEATRIAETIEGLRGQSYPNLALTVVDDGSTDGTRAVLENLGQSSDGVPLRVIAGKARPTGWAGKTWALDQGVAGSTADWLAFVDADMRLHPQAMATAWALAQRTGADLVSPLPRIECTTFWQRAIALALAQLLAQRYPLDRVADPGKSTAFAAGGFILVRRSAYERAGGHSRVRREIIEDIALARRLKRTGGRALTVVAPEIVATHMYGTFGEIWRGLRKNAFAGMNYRYYKYLIGAPIGLVLVATPPLALLGGGWLAATGGPWSGQGQALFLVGALGWLAQGVGMYPFTRFLRAPWFLALSLPLGATAYLAIMTASVWHYLRGRILWKDRAIATAEVRRPSRRARARLRCVSVRRSMEPAPQ